MKTFLAAIFILAMSAINAFSQSEKTYFRTIASNWEGTLEYLDYQENKRVKLKTYLFIKPASDGNSAEVTTVYDDFGRIIKEVGTVKIDRSAMKYLDGDFEYKIESDEPGKIVLSASGQDGEKIEPFRKTITYDENSLVFLKETRTPFQFRNQLTLRRAGENVLAKRTLTTTQMREDLGVLKKTLTAIHPGIYRYQTPESLAVIFAETAAKIKKPLPEGEFFTLVSQITNRIYCGHTFSNPYNADGLWRERLFNQKTYLPFYFRLVDGQIVITENASANALSKGSKIKTINGVPAKAIIEKLLTVTRGDGKNTFEHRANSLELTRFEAERYALFDWFYPLFYPLKDDNFTVEAVDYATKKAFKFQTPAMSKDERTAEMTKRYGKSPTYDDGWKFEIQSDSTGYLKIDNSITWRLKTVKFREFLANAFSEMRAKSVKNLIIDLRGNGGGDMDVGFELSKYLAKTELPVYAESRRLVRNVAAQPELAKYLRTYSKGLEATLKDGVPKEIYKRFDNNFYEILPNENTDNYPKVTPYENNFRGRAFIIADASNASATFQFLSYAQENKLAEIVGQATGGNKQGINGGSYFFLYLPNSKIETDVPVYFQAPLTAQKDESIIPDIAVKREPQDIGSNLDRELATIRKLTAKN